jgi:peptidoglycan/xylan/chitin deacetylase (PgdA/CDA1 family)
MIQTALLTTLCAPFALGTAGIVLAGRSKRTVLPGLLFHSIDTKHPLTMSALPQKAFAGIVNRLKAAGYCSIPLHQTVSSTGTPDTAGKKLLITFDDGFHNFYTQALPVLEMCGFKATLFPVAGFLGRTSTWDVLPPFKHLSSGELRAISGLGHEIGSHTMTHADCTFLDAKNLAAELRDSKHLLEDIIARPVTSISFPFGSWNRRVWAAALEAGYSRATIYRGHHHESPCLFPVCGVYRFDTPESVLARIRPFFPLSLSLTLATLMRQFARGAPLWKFRKEYDVVPQSGIGVGTL